MSAVGVEHLKKHVLVLAGYLALGEGYSAEYAALSMRETVQQIFADKDVSPVALALIATELANHVDAYT